MAENIVDWSRSAVEKSPRQFRIATAGFFFISGFGFSTWASRIPTLQQQLHLSEVQLGAVLFALPMGLLLTLPLTGHLVGRYSSRSIMLIGALLLNLILSLIGLVTQTWQLALVLFAFGAARNLLSISVNAQSIGVQALYDKSILTVFHGIWSIAGFTGAALGSLMISSSIAPAYHFLFAGLFMTVLALGLFPNTLPDAPTTQKSRSGFRLPDRNLIKFGLMSFASMACEGMMYDWSGVYFRKALEVPKELTAVGFVVFMVAMTAGRFAGDRVINRFGKKKVLWYSGFLMFSGLFLAAVWPTLLAAGLGFMMVGFGVSCVVPLVISIASQSSPAATGSVITSVSTIAYFGFLIVPPIVGFLAESLNLRWSFGILSLLGFLIIWLVGKVK